MGWHHSELRLFDGGGFSLALYELAMRVARPLLVVVLDPDDVSRMSKLLTRDRFRMQNTAFSIFYVYYRACLDSKSD